jgi:hypothetical protein
VRNLPGFAASPFQRRRQPDVLIDRLVSQTCNKPSCALPMLIADGGGEDSLRVNDDGFGLIQVGLGVIRIHPRVVALT